ncbi:MAG: Uma2 family endonuclease [Brasilonema octagenarum HA4186-MV1]|uniref:Uma2 family endonuclease n=2 Tax=Brasilonema TaxID=383614 RepID=A0A856MPE3_9CYAN|nr:MULTISPECIES: Uma2 family endonuclease [Brasilonema]MBW4629977.1 Uma2 family endonuclease [Brasilonema octagenarum HA4186-MV1]NMF64752.1 Uma2 family endonuclease [Brasilonema octagenarum UFV-OR1]QDL12412.1 Uma2 family endonuclease [Brasilonema sennae CENA114]QDL18797.1 Uma2 family endonuclease [Brasilonema octagenarum UFV-E1]
MDTVITPERIELPPGAVLKLLGNWQDYQRLQRQLGDRTIPRIKYRHNEILLMAPLPEHGKKASLLALIVTTLLDYLNRIYDSFTPITMSLPEISGIEPDYCFYIENWQQVQGKDRIDWQNDPPPDLAIEVDVTSYTDINDYLPYRVPEVWLLKNNQLLVYRLQGESYALAESSYFPNVSEIVRQCLLIASEQTTSEAIRWLKNFLQ